MFARRVIHFNVIFFFWEILINLVLRKYLRFIVVIRDIAKWLPFLITIFCIICILRTKILTQIFSFKPRRWLLRCSRNSSCLLIAMRQVFLENRANILWELWTWRRVQHYMILAIFHVINSNKALLFIKLTLFQAL